MVFYRYDCDRKRKHVSHVLDESINFSKSKNFHQALRVDNTWHICHVLKRSEIKSSSSIVDKDTWIVLINMHHAYKFVIYRKFMLVMSSLSATLFIILFQISFFIEIMFHLTYS